MPISVVIHTYNASRYLQRVLDSVKDFDEIIICDMESTDSTLDIARSMGCRILSVPKKNYTIPEPYRDYAIHSASYEWVLVVDADELVTPGLKDFLYDHISKPDAEPGVRIPRMNYVFNQFQSSTYPDYQLRFMFRDKAHWPNRIHSLPDVDGEVLTIPSGRKDLAFRHLQSNMRDQITRMNYYTDNELARRRTKKASLWRLWLEPKFRFFKSYVMKGGFRNGTSGYILAKRGAFYRYALLSKLFEEQEGAHQGLNDSACDDADKLNLLNK